MDAYLTYCADNQARDNTGTTEIAWKDHLFWIYNESGPVYTVKGRPFTHSHERVLRMVLGAWAFPPSDDTPQITAPLLYGYQADILEVKADPFLERWSEILACDPFVRIKTTGSAGTGSYNPDHPLFTYSFLTLTALIRSINRFVNSALSEHAMDDSETNPLAELLLYSYKRLSPEQKAVLHAFSALHSSGILLPLGLVLDILTPSEYISGLVALRLQSGSAMTALIPGISRGMDYLACYRQVNEREQPAGELIRGGENTTVEFKSTLRWDIRAGKTNQAIERASLKTISAFLNSHGGTLLIGVRDDGSIEGIETDKFVNEDKFLLHLWTLIRTCLGRDVTPSVQTSLEKTGDRTVCIVKCTRNNRPVFLRQPGFPEEFYIRVGPASNAMDISEALKYIADHFPANS